MTECNTKLVFGFSKSKRLDADFTGGDLSSDGGILLFRQIDEKLKLLKSFSEVISDPRNQERISHTQEELIRQRVMQICAGYEDANDCNSLRKDSAFQMTCGELGKELGSQPTMTRLENRMSKKEISACRKFFIGQFIKSFKNAPAEVVLDIDGWDDPTHGKQQLTMYHGYYGQHMYYPVMINHGGTGFPVVVQLRAGNSHAGKGVAGILRWLFWRLKKAFPDTVITLRGDGGFSLPEIIKVCERSNVYYVLGYAKNAVLERKNADLLEQARVQSCITGKKSRLFDDVYYAAGSWGIPRRIIMKAEWLEKGGNQRFLVTNRIESARSLYDNFYVQRAEDSENRIKELKLGLKADRLSCHKFISNQFRLYLHQLAYVLMLELRKLLVGTRLGRAQVSTLREKLIKLAVRVRKSARRIWVQFASSCPVRDILFMLSRKLTAQS